MALVVAVVVRGVRLIDRVTHRCLVTALPCAYEYPESRSQPSAGCAQVEGTCSGKFGYIVSVPLMQEIGKGVIREGTGFAQFRVKHTAIAFRPFKGEVMDTVVTTVSKVLLGGHCRRIISQPKPLCGCFPNIEVLAEPDYAVALFVPRTCPQSHDVQRCLL